EHEGFDAGGDPVPGLPDVRWQEKKRPEHDQETVTRQPDKSGTRIEERAPHRSRLEGRLEAALEDRRPREQAADPRGERDKEDGGGEVYPGRSEKEEPHSTLNAKPPSVTSASIESTRHLTLYVPRGSAGSVTRSRSGFERSTRPSPRSTCPPRSFTTRTEL